MDKYVIRFLIKKVMAIAMIGLGIYLLVAYMNKQLPFGIVSSDMTIWGLWGYLGFGIAMVIFAGGMYSFSKEFIVRWAHATKRRQR